MAKIWQSKRLCFRSFTPEDDKFVDALHQDSASYVHASPFVPAPPHLKVATATRERLEKALLGVVVCLPASKTDASDPEPKAKDGENKATPIGLMMLKGDEEGMTHHRVGHFGIWISSSHQGQGYGTESILWMLRWAFRMANLHRVDLEAYATNGAAIRLYEKVGFRIEGRKREALWFDGEYHDEVGMGILEREWRERYGDGVLEGGRSS
ncbi:hypothetical protein LTR62_006294 [Meristemomyces frigidus]|uniref:N-acetyltransferase domain-containing protein n=1 Tax=Meristemomyces frigidus TaxID=1508187 RepID=A0AAN7YEM8_9PEZI|nr:hypothetical protein LTR62_006294 [Meristemomyces frigidus]